MSGDLKATNSNPLQVTKEAPAHTGERREICTPVGAEVQDTSAAVNPKIDREVEYLRNQAHEAVTARPPGVVQKGLTTSTQYVEFIGDCLETLVGYLRAGSQAAEAHPLMQSLGSMTLKINATPGVVNLMLYTQGQSMAGIIASVQDVPLRDKDSGAMKAQQWTLVSVLAGGHPSTSEYLKIPIVTDFPFLRDPQEDAARFSRLNRM